MTKEEYNINRPKIRCPICGQEISKPNFKRHFKACDDPDSVLNQKRNDGRHHVSHDGLSCEFCNKLCENLNSLAQHEIRCRNNPNRIKSAKRDFKTQYRNLSQDVKDKMAWSKGLTANTSASVRKQIENRPRTRSFEYIFKEHNENEIKKWIDYTQTIILDIPKYDVSSHGKNNTGYNVIRKGYTKENNTVKILFEHDCIMNLYLNGKLEPQNTVHHVDMNPKNNDITNLIAFETNGEHKRFHNSKYAWLIYNEKTHKFNCVLKKDNNIQ